ncbi:beta-propeller domain-containing protein [Jiangella muralis]|uniref:beta-propeller domain-containing protein n=1 Tax=Jiangella muralis TaxID=702383 RepID=UPI000B26D9C5|nr:beta-propeller domain-containing protein [Jiangella muralis]
MGLTSFDACDDVLDHLKTEASERVGPWGLGGVTEAYAAEGAAEDSAALAAPQDAGRDDSGGAQSHSTTNVQEAGVDEPDVAKTDGRLLVTTTGGDLRIVDVTGDAPREVGRLALTDPAAKPAPGQTIAPEFAPETVDASVFLAGDRVVALVRQNPMIAYDMMPGYAPGGMTSTTAVLLIDISDPAEPVVESRLQVDGDYLDARMVDDTVRLVVSSYPTIEFPMTEADANRPEDELTERNRAIVEESTIADWLPSYTFTSGDSEPETGQLVSCEQVSRPDEFAGFSMLSVLTFDPDDGLGADGSVGVLTDGDTVYASQDRLYVATTRWGDPFAPSDDAIRSMPASGDVTTGIHAFDITGNVPARYLASGEVEGRILGRYAMSEHEGVLRVATTIDSRSGETDTSESVLYTLEEGDGELVQLGQVGGLGKGEQIYAVRYFGDTGYVVTFRQVDPLYVLDLSDPAAPAVTGELKITGYSAYLHDAGDDRLLGVGQEASADGQVLGAQISLFDVADPAAPAKLDGHVVPGAWSQTEWDPQAFLFWADTGQVVVPIESTTGPSALVVRLDGDTVTEQGQVTRTESPRDGWAWLRRTVVVGDTLYTVWQDGVQANGLADLEPRGWLAFGQP